MWEMVSNFVAFLENLNFTTTDKYHAWNDPLKNNRIFAVAKKEIEEWEVRNREENERSCSPKHQMTSAILVSLALCSSFLLCMWVIRFPSFFRACPSIERKLEMRLNFINVVQKLFYLLQAVLCQNHSFLQQLKFVYFVAFSEYMNFTYVKMRFFLKQANIQYSVSYGEF